MRVGWVGSASDYQLYHDLLRCAVEGLILYIKSKGKNFQSWWENDKSFAIYRFSNFIITVLRYLEKDDWT